ncbi:hypothetical protein BUALT_Bualt01G0170200 [Buddleja alternifolia]|uniref:Uncharacterized protein n=1 Tax=Buddleja alternifolia TaxID=168488 RepID=A0AAV6Y7T4_9LAMI|nr:hypothetical protein BUALT_Bualt01G0170200 [Buddleja alternifolia]
MGSSSSSFYKAGTWTSALQSNIQLSKVALASSAILLFSSMMQHGLPSSSSLCKPGVCTTASQSNIQLWGQHWLFLHFPSAMIEPVQTPEKLLMATLKALVFMVVAIMATLSGVFAQGDPSLAPAPSPDVGAGISLPVSVAVVTSSLVLSMIAVMKN